MTTITNSPKPKTKLTPLRIVASVLFFLFGILSALSTISAINFRWNTYQQTSDSLQYLPEFGGVAYFELFALVASIVAPAVAIAVGLVGLLSRKRWLQTVFGAGLFAFAFLTLWVWQLFIVQSNVLAIYESTWTFQFTQEATLFNIGETFIAWVGLICILLALALSTIASITAPSLVTPQSQETLEGAPAKTQPAQAPATVSTSQSNLTNLPMFALIGAFIIPLAGIILGHLSLNYMKKGQLSTQNKGMATAGLILGYVFVGLGFLTGLILFIVLIVSAATGF
jgi:hypothetical protein